MTRRLRALLRLFTIQASWNYERMQGIGMGYAAAPLLEGLKTGAPGRYSEAVARSSEYFNCHPYLAGLAVGALARAEEDAIPGPLIQRLRTALCGPLGALGDQVFWAGLLPALMALTMIAVAGGAGAWAVVSFVVVFNAARLATAWWGLRTGLETGLQVAGALQRSWLPRVGRWLGPAAAFLVGFAVPAGGGYLLSGAPAGAVVWALSVAMLGITLFYRLPAMVTALRYGLVLVAAALLWLWLVP